MRGNLSGAIDAVQCVRCNLCCALRLTVLKSSSPLLAQTSHPPTRNLFGKTHDARDGGAPDEGIDAGILNTDDHLHESMMKVNMTTIFGGVR